MTTAQLMTAIELLLNRGNDTTREPADSFPRNQMKGSAIRNTYSIIFDNRGKGVYGPNFFGRISFEPPTYLVLFL